MIAQRTVIALVAVGYSLLRAVVATEVIEWARRRQTAPNDRECWEVPTVELLRRFVGEDLATETTDYALVVGFIALGSATVVSAVSGSVTSWWDTITTTVTTLFGTT